MKLWLLTKVDGDDSWKQPYEKNHGFVIRALTEARARRLAQASAGDEGVDAWTAEHSTCVELTTKGRETIVLTDFWSA